MPLRTSLLALGCPAINAWESDEDLDPVLVAEEASPDRAAVLEWLVARAEEAAGVGDEEREKMEVPCLRMGAPAPGSAKERSSSLSRRLGALGVPDAAAFVACALGADEQRVVWALLLDVASWPAEDKVTDVYEATEAACARRVQQSAEKFRLIPRDLEKEIKQSGKKVVAPTEEKLQCILQMYKDKIEETKQENDAFSISTTPAEFSDKLKMLHDRLEHVNATFEGSFGRWIPSGKPKLDNDEDFHQALHSILHKVTALSKGLQCRQKITAELLELENLTAKLVPSLDI